MNGWDEGIIALLLIMILGLGVDFLVRLFGTILSEYDMLTGEKKKVIIWKRKKLKKRRK